MIKVPGHDPKSMVKSVRLRPLRGYSVATHNKAIEVCPDIRHRFDYIADKLATDRPVSLI